MVYTNVDKWHFKKQIKEEFYWEKESRKLPLMFTDESVEIQQRKRRKLATEKSDKGLTVTPEGPCL